ncbi:DUF1501 domain-containing protein [Paraburkholderia humisilvae]|uniref:Twin-arginine translocation pathway signal sequence domain-containing protein n=1 Tax=Paraburkholderia humisilvae TaxID=627669 RepID=A0A6J5DB33_9BURK|nr:DUF1501 domain-containing protein [Paraburkholderia humisilvae]CAB3750551.1 hypothetical protein LMG29542_01263 [Paraburkholderia humisilvae]
MKRRVFLSTAAAAGAALSALPLASFASARAGAAGFAQSDCRFEDRVAVPAVLGRTFGRKQLILVELKGGNDGLNTVVPFADPLYYRLRPRLAIGRDAVLPLDERIALHPALRPLMPLWQSGQLAIVQGLGYPQFNLSHFRAMEIWDTGSDAHRYLRDGWVTRALARAHASSPAPARALADALRVDGPVDGLVIDSAEPGPLTGVACRVATLMRSSAGAGANGFAVAQPLSARFPVDAFGTSLRTATYAIAAGLRQGDPGVTRSEPGTAVIRVTLNGFDTHANQRERHTMLLAQLAQGLEALHAALRELGRWDDTLIVTYSEFGRRARENDSGGTDHGSSAPHFVIGGRVRGGLYGAPPTFSQLDGNGNLPMAVDFRRLYATVLAAWWGCDAVAVVLERHFDPLPLLRA